MVLHYSKAPQIQTNRDADTEYHEFSPRADLADTVNCVWTFEGNDAVADQPVVPDGRCELIVHCAEPYGEYFPNSDVAVRQSHVVFAGQVTRPLTLRAQGPVSVVAVRFTPCGAWPFLGESLSDFTDRRIDLSSLLGPSVLALHARIVAAPKTQRAEIAQAFVSSRLDAARDLRDALVERCVSLIYEDRFAAIETERVHAGISARTLQRKFAAVVGVSPRMLAAIVRFRRVFDVLQESNASNWTQAAHAAGYYDLPQLDRDFRRFTGLPPSAFLKSGPGLATSLVKL
jgi:AraC-like DNA-binding protein